jgi:hypothetical protein
MSKNPIANLIASVKMLEKAYAPMMFEYNKTEKRIARKLEIIAAQAPTMRLSKRAKLSMAKGLGVIEKRAEKAETLAQLRRVDAALDDLMRAHNYGPNLSNMEAYYDTNDDGSLDVPSSPKVGPSSISSQSVGGQGRGPSSIGQESVGGGGSPGITASRNRRKKKAQDCWGDEEVESDYTPLPSLPYTDWDSEDMTLAGDMDDVDMDDEYLSEDCYSDVMDGDDMGVESYEEDMSDDHWAYEEDEDEDVEATVWDDGFANVKAKTTAKSRSKFTSSK